MPRTPPPLPQRPPVSRLLPRYTASTATSPVANAFGAAPVKGRYTARPAARGRTGIFINALVSSQHGITGLRPPRLRVVLRPRLRRVLWNARRSSAGLSPRPIVVRPARHRYEPLPRPSAESVCRRGVAPLRPWRAPAALASVRSPSWPLAFGPLWPLGRSLLPSPCASFSSRLTGLPVVPSALLGLPSGVPQCVVPYGIPPTLSRFVTHGSPSGPCGLGPLPLRVIARGHPSALLRRSGSCWRLGASPLGCPLPTSPFLGFSRGLASCPPLHAEWCWFPPGPSPVAPRGPYRPRGPPWSWSLSGPSLR